MLHSQNISPCLLGAVEDLNLRGPSVAVSGTNPPEICDFIYGESSLFQMYKRSLIKAMPNFFGISVCEIW